MNRYLIEWIDSETDKKRKAAVQALTKEMAFNKLLKDERYEESLYLTFGKDIDKKGHECIKIREIKPDSELTAIYL